MNDVSERVYGLQPSLTKPCVHPKVDFMAPTSEPGHIPLYAGTAETATHSLGLAEQVSRMQSPCSLGRDISFVHTSSIGQTTPASGAPDCVFLRFSNSSGEQ